MSEIGWVVLIEKEDRGPLPDNVPPWRFEPIFTTIQFRVWYDNSRDCYVYEYNPFGSKWEQYQIITAEVRRGDFRRVDLGKGLLTAYIVLKAQREMRFYRVERIDKAA